MISPVVRLAGRSLTAAPSFSPCHQDDTIVGGLTSAYGLHVEVL
jgi:hypothetical protein